MHSGRRRAKLGPGAAFVLPAEGGKGGGGQRLIEVMTELPTAILRKRRVGFWAW